MAITPLPKGNAAILEIQRLESQYLFVSAIEEQLSEIEAGKPELYKELAKAFADGDITQADHLIDFFKTQGNYLYNQAQRLLPRVNRI